MENLRIVAGKADDVARALMDDKPVSAELAQLYSRTLETHLTELVEQHGVTIDPLTD